MKALFTIIEEQGWQGRIIPIGRLADLRQKILDPLERGLFNGLFFSEKLNFLSFDPPADLPYARSIIIIALPTPQIRVFFRWRNKRVPVVIPPTYAGYTPRDDQVIALLAGGMRTAGYRLAKSRLPLKTLAVCSGLAEYGRNNICHVEGLGSFFQLVGAYSDIPCEDDPWQEPKVLDRCAACTACLKNCPTGAIPEDRFLLRAELCLTYHNEAVCDFPEWIDPSWHHCLVGCMRCQTVCPENRGVRNWFEDRCEFTEEETALLLRKVAIEHLPDETVTKIRSLEINENYRSICRNLSMILG